MPDLPRLLENADLPLVVFGYVKVPEQPKRENAICGAM
jgi:hypothetical protein